MAPMKALVAGHGAPAAALASALSASGIEARVGPAPRGGTPERLAAAFHSLEDDLTGVGLAVAVGTGDGPVALAVSAAKLGIPLAVWRGAEATEPNGTESEARIIATLAGYAAGSEGEALRAEEAARRIREWALLDSER